MKIVFLEIHFLITKHHKITNKKNIYFRYTEHNQTPNQAQVKMASHHANSLFCSCQIDNKVDVHKNREIMICLCKIWQYNVGNIFSTKLDQKKNKEIKPCYKRERVSL